MQTKNRFLDDFARLANTAISTVAGVKQEIEAIVKHKFNNHLSELDLVSREDFEAVKAMAVKARLEQEKIQKRLDRLESNLQNRAKKRSGN